jgi:cytochrome c peroxidase
MLTLGQALASYQRSLVSADSPFDRWYFGKQSDAVSESVKRGFAIFNGKGACSGCHTIESKHAIFTDNQTHNTGVGYRESMQILPEKQSIQVAPGVFASKSLFSVGFKLSGLINGSSVSLGTPP